MKIYLGCPYSGNEEENYNKVCKITADLMKEGHIVFAPIAHCHPIAIKYGLPGDWEFWKKYDEAFLEWCEGFYYCKFAGWEKSTGLQAEFKIAFELNKIIKGVEDDGTVEE